MGALRDILITDRTYADVEQARWLSSLWDAAAREWRGTEKEWAEYEAGLKGCYNAADLNRVTLAASYLLTRLSELGYRVPAGVYPASLVSVSVDPPGSGTAKGVLFYKGEPVTVRAEPVGGSLFRGWLKDGETVSENAEYTFTPDGDTALTALFEASWVIESSIVGAGRIGRAILGRSWM